MDLSAIFLLLLVLAFIVLFVSRPFFARQRVRSSGESRELSTLLAERERLLTALQDLDSDQALGKIPEEDYPTQRADLLQRGAEVLRQIDAALSDRQAPGSQETGMDIPTASHVPLTEDVLDELLAMRRNARKEKTGGFCPKCGKPVLMTDIFCPSCGNILREKPV